MSQQMGVIRYTAHPHTADENQRLVERVFAQLADTHVDIQYTVLRLDDGVTFVHIVITHGTANPLPELDTFRKFQQDLAKRIIPGSLTRTAATLVGAYRFIDR